MVAFCPCLKFLRICEALTSYYNGSNRYIIHEDTLPNSETEIKIPILETISFDKRPT